MCLYIYTAGGQTTGSERQEEKEESIYSFHIISYYLLSMFEKCMYVVERIWDGHSKKQMSSKKIFKKSTYRGVVVVGQGNKYMIYVYDVLSFTFSFSPPPHTYFFPLA